MHTVTLSLLPHTTMQDPRQSGALAQSQAATRTDVDGVNALAGNIMEALH